MQVVMDENNPYILDYKNFAEKILGKSIEFEHIGGATDSRAFAVRGSIVIMHSGSGEGMHASGEYVELDSVEKIAEIQMKFLEKLAK
jgi:acetylornithine deacetylase/succinyl-diaminopimelate desuccinylase-like protein